MPRAWVVHLVAWLPQGPLSRAWGWLARRRRPRALVRLGQRAFVRAVGINMAEAPHKVEAYPSLEALFVRALIPGSRPLAAEEDAVVGPVDGTVGACGTVEAGTCLQVKGRRYRVAELLADDEAARRYEGGRFATFYLAPKNYHRVHAPVAGTVAAVTWVPGGLMPVFPEALSRIDALFARNERVITYLDSGRAGRLAVVKVGATLVGRIQLAFDPTVVGNPPGRREVRRLHYAPPHALAKGEELGTFSLGSTVILLAEPGRVHWEGLVEGASQQMGARIGRCA